MRNSQLLFLVLAVSIFLLPLLSFAEDISQVCSSFMKNLDKECEKVGLFQCRQILENCEKYYQQKSEEYQAEISEIKNKKKTLENEIARLTTKIKSLENNIYRNNLIIKNLNFQISDTEKSIDNTSAKINDLKSKLSSLLQLRYEEDKESLIETFLGGEKFSDFFGDLVALDSLNLEMQKVIADIKGLKSSLEEQRDLMIAEKTDLENTQIMVNLQKEENENLKRQKDALLKQTKGQEALYQKYLKETEAKAQEIRKKIFELAQVSEAEALTLEQAYSLAVEVEKITGVRPAFLLGLLKVESDIGNNVGQCNCAGAAFCRHPEIGWKDVMPSRHWPFFLEITEELGLNPQTTPVSCAVGNGKIQWGGAMGPAQFMPETWLKTGYKERVEKITAKKPASPWRVKDAFLAAGLYLSDWGAGSQIEAKEIGAARAYLCGTDKLTLTCQISGGVSYVSNIMKYANQFQDYVDRGILK